MMLVKNNKTYITFDTLATLFLLKIFFWAFVTSLKFCLWVHINRVIVVSWRAIVWAIYTDRFILVGAKSLLKDKKYSFMPQR